LRFEELQSGISLLERNFGLSLELPHLLKNDYKAKYEDVYDEELRSLVADIYKEDIERFNYRFAD
ncbi:MAG: hypothetical protein R3275_07130, partial [Saprospiraceae bacterium]|nr:hypothetical protein [Saprospiraceae bacterium]